MEETEKKDIQDAEVSQVDQEKNIKKSYRTEIFFIFVIGLLIGIMVKAESVKKISIGFNDYKVVAKTQEYNIEAIEKSLFEKTEKAKEAVSEEAKSVIVEDTDTEQE